MAERSFLGDGDPDNPTDLDGDGNSPHHIGTGEYRDGDADSDSKTKESYRYHDKDDTSTLNYGSPADAADRQAIATVVERYYAAASSGNAATACSLFLPNVAQSLPEEYGRGDGPAYLRGGKTCQQIMSLLFKYLHAQLHGASKVTSVRINGNEAHAFVGSDTNLANVMIVNREGHTWKIGQLIGGPIP